MDQSFVHFGIKDLPSLHDISLIDAKPVLSGQLLNLRVSGIKFGKGEVLKCLVLFPSLRELCSSPHPNTINFIVLFFSIDSINSKAIFSEMFIKVSQMPILQVAG